MANSEKINIIGYMDYRAFLKDFYEFKKSQPRGYSYRKFSKAAGFSSPNILKLVIEGSRNIGGDSIHNFCTGLGLEGVQKEYFLLLVEMNQAKDDSEKEALLLELMKLIPYSKRRVLDTESLTYLSNWLYPVLRDMILLDGFSEDPYWISRRMIADVSPNQIRAAIKFLLTHEFIERDEGGALKPSDRMVALPDEVANLAGRNYHRQMLNQAYDIVEKLDVSKREYHALTFVLPDSSMPELKTKIKNFVKETHEWAVNEAEREKTSSVIQVNLQMYPHCMNAKEGNE